MTDKPKSKRGGRRAGAGRPRGKFFRRLVCIRVASDAEYEQVLALTPRERVKRMLGTTVTIRRAADGSDYVIFNDDDMPEM